MQLADPYRNLQSVIMRYEEVWPSAYLSPDSPLYNANDKALLKALQSGKKAQVEDAFAVLYNRHNPEILAILRSRNITEEDVRELVNDIWMKFIDRLPTFKWQGKPLKHSLLAITRIKRQEYFRQLDTDDSLPLENVKEEALKYIESQLDGKDRTLPPNEVQKKATQLLAQLLPKLSLRARKILTLAYFKGKSDLEIAEELGMKYGAVRTAKSRALKKLKDIATKQQEAR